MSGSGVRFALSCAVGLAAIMPRAATAQVRFERLGYRLTSIGERIAVSARVVDSRRQPVSNVNIRWRVADPTIATVNSQGVVVSRRPGHTKVWAVAGEDSASALILVDQWAAKFVFLPAAVRLDAVGAKLPLRIQVRDAAGYPIAAQNRRPSACRSLNEQVATMAPNGEVTAHTNGVTYVRCTDRGIADSVRVEVRQRPVRAAIADKLAFGNKIVGDTFRIRVNATDAAGDNIRDVQATWASLRPTIVSIDPLNGAARAVGPGTAKIVAQAGDVTDTVSVAVAAAPGMAPPVEEDSAGVPTLEAVRTATLKIESLFPFEGDTTSVRFTARDVAGVEVADPDVTLRSKDETIFVVLPGRRILPKKAGSAFLVGRFGTNVLDSTLVTVRSPLRARDLATDESATRSTFKRPTFDTAAARSLYDTAMARARDSILKFSPVGRPATGRLISISAAAGQAAHSFSDSTGRETRSGLLYGGIAEIAPLGWLKLGVEFRTGTLSTSGTAGGSDMAVTEAGADLTIQPVEWFGLRGGYVRRAVREGLAGEPVARQRWEFPRASAVFRFTFVGDAVTTVTAISVLPFATYSGYQDLQGNEVKPNPLSLAGEAGLELRSRWFSTGLTYYVEKFTFPRVGTSDRVDQFSTIRLRIGLQAGR